MKVRIHLTVRHFLMAFSILTLACSSDPTSDPLRDSMYLDSTMKAMLHAEGWEKFDSIPSKQMELWRKEGEGNIYAIELRYVNNSGRLQRVPLTDSFPFYMYYQPSVDLEFEQLTGYGSSEVLIRFGGSWSAGQPGMGRVEELECFYVVDLENSGLLWRGCSLYHFEQMVEAGAPDTLFGAFKVGYDYKVHARNGELIIDSLNYFGDSIDGPDHLPGRYQWKNGAFSRL